MNKQLPTFRRKLWLYFLALAIVILAALWLLQTVFLQSFYDRMLIQNARRVAESLAASEPSDAEADAAAYQNGLLIYILDDDGNVYYSADEYKTDYSAQKEVGDAAQNPYAQDGSKQSWKNGVYRNLPDNAAALLESMQRDGTDSAQYRTDAQYAYGIRLQSGRILYVGTALGSVSGAVAVVRTQLLIVTGLSLLLAFVLAYQFADRFSRPITTLHDKAQALGTEQYPPQKEKPFCAELEQLSETLDRTNDRLLKDRDFQRDFLAGVSHDLRTPLTLIKGYAEVISDDAEQPQSKADAEVIIREADRLSALVNDILQFSELETEHARQSFSRMNLTTLIQSVLDQFALFTESGGELDAELTPDIYILGNEAQVKRVIYNLLDNAIRHAGTDRTVQIRLYAEDVFAVLSVSDHGNGIPAEDLDHIWEKYYTARSRGRQGTSGLGLAIVKAIVTQHGGTVKTESEVGKGSRFTVLLPQSRKRVE